ncbi:hypothetical protein [Nocardia gamkensis]|uniref:Uncharacterized protein n=1 Tax=Nocardia gamkensis TaxID=352869 RepID=A0A7X6R3Z5_9NOCA|nr:hypothetical protein [Nocardia gamkensis]NKY27776.1 hypothetical protein [Nocardia gamkensis]NQE67417.1 hypothetical protein [Nocardia gamkensis]
MSALTGAPAPDDLPTCTALASWIVNGIHKQIAALNDPMDKGIAQIALAAHPDLHGKYIEERLKAFCNKRTFTKNQYYDRRRRVVREITAGLVASYHARNAKGATHVPADRGTSPVILRTGRVPNIFLAGYYRGSSLDPVATTLGATLAQQPVPVNVWSMASKAGLLTGYAMAAESKIMNTYTPERYTLFRRTGSRRRQPIYRYLGRTECLPGSLNEARLSILSRSDIAIAFAGDAGTAYELQLADQLGIPVVPFAATGGAAWDRWEADSAAIAKHDPTIAATYHDLANPDKTTSLHATVRMVTHLLLEPAS